MPPEYKLEHMAVEKAYYAVRHVLTAIHENGADAVVSELPDRERQYLKLLVSRCLKYRELEDARDALPRFGF